MTRVLVVDDQVLIRAGLAALISAAPGLEVVGQAENGHVATVLAPTCRPDVILMDIRMPVLDGVKATERILTAAGAAATGPPSGAPVPRILVLTTFDLDEYVFAALRAGASGFLLKEVAPDRLLAAIELVADGDTLFAPSVTRRLIEAYTRSHKAQRIPAVDLSLLTARETEVLRLVAKGMSNGDIADFLVLSEATVKTHLNRCMTKLDLSSRAQAVVIAYEAGLVVPARRGGPWQ
ncbi:response regulator transcription factor [Plantactinospora sp. S1510]|uniref:Response regulator transcription factor n=1 Tax=Plantactinospora alkalitolerans TaxID=2789879 RepID=A0ABS0GQI6_9ACTN|nr:response regulator transcription factor [Plantactinospora alkalitolerans]MBF9128450.1 response regulator transcription factor [Plantactinospora alkalitolerans]